MINMGKDWGTGTDFAQSPFHSFAYIHIREALQA
jgi:hypothetical protein